MIASIKEHKEIVEKFKAKDTKELEAFRIQYLGKKGILNDFFKAFREVPAEEKKVYGQEINQLKELINTKL